MCFPTQNMHKPHAPKLFGTPLDTRGSSQMKPGQDETQLAAKVQNQNPNHVYCCEWDACWQVVIQPPKPDQPTFPCTVPANPDLIRDSFAQQNAKKHR